MSAQPHKGHDEAKQETAAAERVIGLWYCGVGGHRTRAPWVLRNGRRVCQRCVETSKRLAKTGRNAR